MNKLFQQFECHIINSDLIFVEIWVFVQSTFNDVTFSSVFFFFFDDDLTIPNCQFQMYTQ